MALEKKISLNIIKRVCGLNPWVTLHVRWPHNLPTFNNNYYFFKSYQKALYISTFLLGYSASQVGENPRNEGFEGFETRVETTSFIKSVFNLFAMQIQWTARFICDRRSSPLIIIFSHLRESTIIPNVTMVREAVVHIS